MTAGEITESMVADKNAGLPVAQIAAKWGVHRDEITNLFTMLRRCRVEIKDGRTGETRTGKPIAQPQPLTEQERPCRNRSSATATRSQTNG